MIELACKQTLYIERTVEFGAYLVDESKRNAKDVDKNEHVLLPKKFVPDGAKPGDEVFVFVYKDNQGRMIATTTMPKIVLHEVGRLKVSMVGKIGAFLDWGLEKELLLPFAEQTKRVKAGDEVLAAVYLDKSNRIAATMNVYPYLTIADGLKKDDRVTGTVYEISDNFGAFVAIDDKYQGLIPKRELYGHVEIGDSVEARVVNVRDDGKVNLSIRDKAYVQIEADAAKLLDIINSYDGVLPFTDKANPEVINRETGMSKNEFKKAVGNLYKNRKIEITDDNKIRLI